MNEFPLLDNSNGVPLFFPYVPESAIEKVKETLKTRWIGQGPKVDKFEQKILELFAPKYAALAVGSGTDALHLAYILADIKKGDEVLVPVFTCTATNIPLLYIGAKPIFIDINPNTMNIDLKKIESHITKKTKAIVCVDYGGYPCDYDELLSLCKKHKLKLISDAAHSIGTKYRKSYACALADFTIFSFQAIKTITTGDGGMLLIKDRSLIKKAKRIRWFGIDREAKQGGIWENDIHEIGYKYQMTDISASMGLASLNDINKIISYRKKIFSVYRKNLSGLKGLEVLPKSSRADDDFCPWMVTILTDHRLEIMKALREHNIESAQVHYRNDRYSIFGKRTKHCNNMDEIENKYLVLPLHMRLKDKDVKTICNIIKKTIEKYQ